MDKNQAVRELSQLLPLEDELLLQMVENAQKLPTHSAITEYWIGLLGESPDALNFITKFTTSSSNQSSSKSTQKSKASPSYSSASSSNSNKINTKNPWNQPVVEKPELNNKPRLSKNISSTTSQLLDKPKDKVPKQTEKRRKQNRIDNLKDIEAVLRQLEVDNKDENSVCNCMARVHPLFEVAPNCLNCGKIICAKEGLRPCSSCGHELINPEEKKNIISLLELEKNELENVESTKKVTPVETNNKKKKITIALGAGSNLWEQQNSMFEKLDKMKTAEIEKKNQQMKEDQELEEQNKELKYYESQKEIDPHLLRAKQNLANLLNFQENGAERTKIIDNASDFELPTGTNLNMWSSGVEKALQLKKQQKQLRKKEKRERELTGRGKRVLDISIGKDGKAVMREVQVQDIEESDDENDEEIEELEKDIKKAKDVKAADDYKAIWDYEKDSNKWDKPIYVGDDTKTNTEEENDFPEFGEWDRVQNIGPSDNIEELVAVI